ncbi:hypothetical protein ACTWQF_36520 [Streptomyces sp. 8N114]|uniref:hypothetical protein n=1 Tax=Streptomyces sp. 8N114 TaxID=3457419 RepID=UPI003FD60A1C
MEFYTDEWEEIEDVWEPFGEAIQRWYETGLATATCQHCGQAGDLTRWTWEDDYYAFGYLGFEFWDWPEFSPRFLERFAHALGGHRTVLVWGKL